MLGEQDTMEMIDRMAECRGEQARCFADALRTPIRPSSSTVTRFGRATALYQPGRRNQSSRLVSSIELIVIISAVHATNR
jgi:hypothetical protein